MYRLLVVYGQVRAQETRMKRDSGSPGTSSVFIANTCLAPECLQLRVWVQISSNALLAAR
jgi:hypothetical protein